MIKLYYVNKLEDIKMKRTLLAISTIVLLLNGCMSPSTTQPMDTGASPDTLKTAASSQHVALATIRDNTTDIVTSTKEEQTKQKATAILTVLPDAEYGNKVLQSEADGKEITIEHIREIEKKLNAYEQEDNKLSNRLLLILKLVGGIMIPIGLFLMTRGLLFAIWISIGGVFAILLSTIISYIEHNGMWIALAITAVALIPILKTFFSQNKALSASVKVAETLKRELLKHAPAVVVDLFGDDHYPGKIVQDETTKSIIRGQRKRIAKEWAPVVPVVEQPKVTKKKTVKKKTAKKA